MEEEDYLRHTVIMRELNDAAHRWNEKYAKGETHLGTRPSRLLVERHELLPPGGEALDIAMGSGRNSLYLASLGFSVTGIDLSSVGIKICQEEAGRRNLSLNTIIADLESYSLPTSAYNLVINFYYLNRPLVQQLVRALCPGGVLVFETFTVSQEESCYGPSNPEWLLRPNELQGMFPQLEPLFYQEGVVESDQGPKSISSLIAQMPGYTSDPIA